MNISLQNSGQNSGRKPKLLVVDDEQDNLDLLYRTFRRDFQVFKAESGVYALEVLKQEGEVAVIISDQRMPEMKGTEFLSKTVPEFPDTIRIVLTGFTDVEDLVEAINSGQVYKYITKPWDPDELKGVVLKATQTYDLLKQRSEELRRSQAQNTLLSTVLDLAQTLDTIDAFLQPIATAFGENFAADRSVFQLVEHGALTTQSGIYGTASDRENWLEQDPLTQQSIDTKQIQIQPDLQSDGQTSSADIRTHLVAPIVYRGEVLAVISLQWHQVKALASDEIGLVQQCVDQVSIALICIRYNQSIAH